MKTKLIKHSGYWTLVVVDKVINEKYNASQDNPIVLGSIHHFFSSGCWGVCDFRLNEFLFPSPYLEEGIEIYKPKDEKDKDMLLSQLRDYKVRDNGQVYWHTFNTFCYDRDIPSHTDKYGNEQSVVARFSFSQARKRLSSQKAFWEKFQGDDLTADCVRIPNPWRQMHVSDYTFNKLMSAMDSEKN